MQYIIGHKINGLISAFGYFSRTEADQWHSIFIKQHPEFYMDATDYYGDDETYFYGWDEDDLNRDTCLVDGKYFKLELNNMNLRSNADFIQMCIEHFKVPDSYKVVEVPNEIKPLLCESDCGSEWLCEPHKVWY